MENERIYLYETTSFFRLTLETIYETKKKDGTYQGAFWPSTYTNKETGHTTTTYNFKPTVMLAFTVVNEDYKDTKAVYVSVKYMPQIRSMFAQMLDIISQADITTDLNGTKVINPKYDQPIGFNKANNDWISLRPMVIKDPTSLLETVGVALQTSKSNGYSAALDFDDFLCINDMFQHLDYVNLIASQALTKLVDSKQQSSGYQKTNGGYQSQAKPFVRTTGYQQQPQQQTYVNAQPMYQQPVVQTRPAANFNTPVAASAPVQQSTLPPRPAPSAAKSKISFDAIKNVEVEDMDIDDESAINDIALGGR